MSTPSITRSSAWRRLSSFCPGGVPKATCESSRVQEKPTLELVTASRNPLLLEGLRSLSALGNFRVVGEASDAHEARRLVFECQPHILLMDDAMVMHEVSLVPDCRQACPGLKVVLLEGATDFVYTLPPTVHLDAFVRRTSSMAALSRVLSEL